MKARTDDTGGLQRLAATAGKRFVWLKLDEHPSWTALWWKTKWLFKKVSSKGYTEIYVYISVYI